MINTTNMQPKLKRPEDLTLNDLDMIYSLSRIGDWSGAEIGRRYGISASDVKKIVEDYVGLRKLCERKLPEEGRDREPELTTKKQRKRRSDARYGSDRERQAAYRKRLQDRSPGEMTHPPAY
jgi:DNA-binding MarR family transcriptional regulator